MMKIYLFIIVLFVGCLEAHEDPKSFVGCLKEVSYKPGGFMAPDFFEVRTDSGIFYLENSPKPIIMGDSCYIWKIYTPLYQANYVIKCNKWDDTKDISGR